MKRTLTLLAALFMVAAVTATASAEMVNLGIIEMERTDLARLQGLVSGDLSLTSETPVVERPAEVNTGLIKMNADELAVIRDTVAGRREFTASTGKVTGEKMVNIGLVSITESDHKEIEQMVMVSLKNRKLPRLLSFDMPVALNR